MSANELLTRKARRSGLVSARQQRRMRKLSSDSTLYCLSGNVPAQYTTHTFAMGWMESLNA